MMNATGFKLPPRDCPVNGCVRQYRSNLKQHFNSHHSNLNYDEYKNNRKSTTVLIQCSYESINGSICNKKLRVASMKKHLTGVHKTTKDDPQYISITGNTSGRNVMQEITNAYELALLTVGVGGTEKTNSKNAREYKNIVLKYFFNNMHFFNVDTLEKELSKLSASTAYKHCCVILQFIRDFLLVKYPHQHQSNIENFLKSKRKLLSKGKQRASRIRAHRDQHILRQNTTKLIKFVNSRAYKRELNRINNNRVTNHFHAMGMMMLDITINTGSRPGYFKNMTVKECKTATKMARGHRQIHVTDQKVSNNVGYVSVNKLSYTRLRTMMNMCDKFRLSDRSNTDLAFVNSNGREINPGKLIQRVLSKYAGITNIKSTIIRKFVTSLFKNASRRTKKEIARSVGHTSNVQERYYTLYDEPAQAFRGSQKISTRLRKMSRI